MSDLVSLLFQTDAFKICKENEPFWYTSGKIGPYFVNTQFLYGSEKDSKDLLDFIDSELENSEKSVIPSHIFTKVWEQYENNEIFKKVINTLKDYATTNVDLSKIDYISGGERRDWFFSNILAHLLNKPHITIFKDLSVIESSSDFQSSKQVENFENKNVLHVADLLNTASSYERAWIPALRALNANIVASIVIVDRMQGGSQILAELGVQSLSLLQIDEALFQKAKELGIINDVQLDMLHDYTANPDETMRNFLTNHPEFLENALNSDNAKTVKRAKACVEQDLYQLN